MGKYYVVWSGKRPGIFDNWGECEQQVKGFAGAKFKSFPSYDDAYEAFTGRPPAQPLVAKPKRPEGEYICVDAAFSSSNNAMEYQGIIPETGECLFHYGPAYDGTNNVGEFLAIVHALSFCQKKGINLPIYSDSKTAMTWVRHKRPNTNLEKTDRNDKIFELLKRAEMWLKNNSYSNEIIKWETTIWGENPADFGRK
jgi:ribonuclease HI